MTLIDLVRISLTDEPEFVVENFINETYRHLIGIEYYDSDYDPNHDITIKRTYNSWINKYENRYHFSIFKWCGQYWKNGDKKLEYVCELNYDPLNTCNDIRDQTHKLPSINEYTELLAFDLVTGNYSFEDSKIIMNYIKYHN